MKLDAKAFGLACGLLWAFGVVTLGLLSITADYGTGFVSALGSVYLGYDASTAGIVIGAIWGFLDGGIGGWLLALLYNKLAK